MNTPAMIDMEALQDQTAGMIRQLAGMTKQAQDLLGTLMLARSVGDAGDQWAQRHGEVMRKAEAARVIGISISYLSELISAGKIECNHDGFVITRSAAAWATGRTLWKKTVEKSKRQGGNT